MDLADKDLNLHIRIMYNNIISNIKKLVPVYLCIFFIFCRHTFVDYLHCTVIFSIMITPPDKSTNDYKRRKVLSLHLTWCIFSSQLILASMSKRERLLFSARFVHAFWESSSGLVYDVEKLMQI